MKKGKSIGLVLVWTLIVVWALLFFTGSGVLIWASERDSSLGTMLECTYFTGTGVIKHDHLKTSIDVLGREVCPRIVDLD